jgi:aspartate aminotransferase-like enzyme
MKNRVACCYLTHEHPQVMDEVLSRICKTYGDKGIDIYVYDSSASSGTKEIVDGYISSGAGNLYYVPMQFMKNEKGKKASDILEYSGKEVYTVKKIEGWGKPWKKNTRNTAIHNTAIRDTVIRSTATQALSIVPAIPVRETRWIWPSLRKIS